jgi:thiosulfate/3-mercaptopyruvate sulfurtransferase
MTYTTLIDAAQLAAALGRPSLVVVDCRFELKDTSAGERAYAVGHIPGAVYAHLDRDLAGAVTGQNGRHPLPDIQSAARTFGRLGIDATTQVVAYDQDTGAWASRLWWMLRWLGHDQVAVVDGGFARWVAEGRPTSDHVDRPTPRTFVPHPRAEMLATVADVAAHTHDRRWRLLDARAPERFRGEVEPIDKAAGHIPGAANLPFPDNLTVDGTFRPPADLAARFSDALGDVPVEHVVAYCGSGVTACHNLLALEHAGLHGAKLYAGSWSEWSADPSRPIATGE